MKTTNHLLQQPIILDIQEPFELVEDYYASLCVCEKPLEELIRDIVAHVSIDAEAKSGIVELQQQILSDHRNANEDDRNMLVRIVEVLGGYLHLWFTMHRLYDDTGALNYQFNCWVRPGVMLLLPIKKLNQ